MAEWPIFVVSKRCDKLFSERIRKMSSSWSSCGHDNRTNPSGRFQNVAEAQSLANVIDCLNITEGEVHTQSSHVWWNPAPLELVFDLSNEFTIDSFFFWNYFGEGLDRKSVV